MTATFSPVFLLQKNRDKDFWQKDNTNEISKKARKTYKRLLIPGKFRKERGKGYVYWEKYPDRLKAELAKQGVSRPEDLDPFFGLDHYATKKKWFKTKNG